MNFTEPQIKILKLAAEQQGYIVAGKTVVKGCVVNVSARTLDALVRAELAEPRISPDGGYSVKLTERGFAAARWH